MDSANATITAILIVGGLFLAIAWIMLPFTMMGIKPLLRDLIAQHRITNHHLQVMQNAEQAALSAKAISEASTKTVEITAPWEK